MVTLRPLLVSELQAATELCLRSKAYWGYDAAFMDACRAGLTIGATDLARDHVVVANIGPEMAGVAQVAIGEARCSLEKLFVEPRHLGKGIGRRLFQRSVAYAKASGAHELWIESDPFAVPFYERMGCVLAGTAPSGSIVGRRIPLLVHRDPSPT